MNIVEAAMLKAQGYIPENVQACRDFNAGKITQDEMFRILHKNINLNSSDHILKTGNWTRPQRGHAVAYFYSDDIAAVPRLGKIVDIDWEDGEQTDIFVDFSDGEQLCFDAHMFDQHTSKGGPTRWLIFSEG